MPITIIVVRSTVNGRWNYCPKAARDLLRPELAEHGGYPSLPEALDAIERDKTMPPNIKVEIEGAEPIDMAQAGMPFLAAAKRAFDELEAECNAPRGPQS